MDRERLYDILTGELVTTELRLADSEKIEPETRIQFVFAGHRAYRRVIKLGPKEIAEELRGYVAELRRMEQALVG